MDFEPLSRIAFSVFVALASAFFAETFYTTVVRPMFRRRDVNRRLSMQKSLDGERAMLAIKQERGIGGGSSGWLGRLLIQSGLRLRPQQFLLYTAVLFFVTFALLNFLSTMAAPVKLLAALAFGFLLPLLVVRKIRARRMKAFAAQLPDALDIIVRSLRSGHPVPVAMTLVGRELADPIGSEFGLTVDEMTYGLDLATAIRNMGDRVGVEDLTLLITAVSLQAQSGGNLGEVLSNLSKVLRERFQLQRKVRALSAEGRISGYCLAVLPFAIAGAIFWQNKRYYLDVANEPLFVPVLVGLGLWSLLGDLIMYKMVNFKY